MNFLNIDFKRGLIIFAFLALPLLSLNSQKQVREQSWFDRPFSFLASNSESLFYGFSNAIRGTTIMYLDLIDTKKESSRVAQENRLLKAKLEQFNELLKENDRLNQLISFKTASRMELVAARIISRDVLPDHNSITINRGTKDGLKAGMAVITTSGVVGSVFRPELLSSQVLLITDRFSVVDGLDDRSRARGIIEGLSHESCLMVYVDKSDDIKAGDTIVTSGLDNIFPKGFPVARVEKVENSQFSPSMRVELRPLVESNNIEEVFVIKSAANEEYALEKDSSPILKSQAAKRVGQ